MQHFFVLLFPLIVFALALGTAFFIGRVKGKIVFATERKETIDGLRGFLAIGVFIHHSYIWYGYLHTSKWHSPDSNLYLQLGQTSVFFFFMITSFLFTSKLLSVKHSDFNFRKFFVTRVFRIVPMYYFTLALSVLAIMSISNWQLHVSLLKFIESMIKWMSFTILWSSINASPYSGITDAGVIWSLPYEWLFYFSLPLLALFISRHKPKPVYVVISIAFTLLFQVFHGLLDYNTLSFSGGIIAAFLSRSTALKTFAKSQLASILIFIALALLGIFHSAANPIGICLVSIIFLLIASGNTLFGILKSPSLQLLGDISYSTYLLQGIVLFSTFYFGFTFPAMQQISIASYGVIICCLTPILVLLSYWGFRFIEQPFIEWGKRLSKRLK